MKAKHDNNLIDCIGMVFVENEIKLLWPINQVQSLTKTN